MSAHVLTVTSIDEDTPEFTLTGPHDDQCAVWWECRDCKDVPSPEDREFEDPLYEVDLATFHGVDHRYLDYGWYTRSTDCAGLACEDADDYVHEIARDRGVGTWLIEIVYEGDGEWIARDLTEADQ